MGDVYKTKADRERGRELENLSFADTSTKIESQSLRCGCVQQTTRTVCVNMYFCVSVVERLRVWVRDGIEAPLIRIRPILKRLNIVCCVFIK